MGVTCDVLLKKVKGNVFRPGKHVAGKVEYVLDKPTKFESIDLYFVGKGTCFWSESDSGDTKFYQNKEEYISVYKDLLPTANGETIEAGTFKHPFKFSLPKDVPTSIKTNQCIIEYKITVIFVKANCFKTTKKFDIEVPVCGYASRCFPEPLVFTLKAKPSPYATNNEANVTVEMEKKMVAPGEDIKLTVTIKNDPGNPIKYLKSKLMKYLTFISDTGRTFTECGPVKNTRGCSPKLKPDSESTYTCIVPTMPNSCSIQHSKILIGEYKVRLTVKYPFPHPKASLDIPVVIGESQDSPGFRDQQDEKPSCSKMIIKESRRDSSNIECQAEVLSYSKRPEQEERRDTPVVEDEQDRTPSSTEMHVKEECRDSPIFEDQNDKPSTSEIVIKEKRRELDVFGDQQEERISPSEMAEEKEREDRPVVADQHDEKPSCSGTPDEDISLMKRRDTIIVKLI